MTANQRRPGFRLPWSAETGEPGDTEMPEQAAESAADGTPESAAEDVSAAAPDAAAPEAPPSEAPAAPEAPPSEAPAAPAATDGGDEFMRDLVDAMRRVAEETRETSVSELRAKADEQVRHLDGDAQRRQEDLRSRAEADVAGVGEWAKAEAERITQEAEQRVVARRSQLEQQLASDASRTEAETKAVRDRVAEYERELEAYHSQLTDIKDPAAFAAAAKRMPKAPALVAPSAPATAPTEAPATPAPTEAPATPAPPEPSSTVEAAAASSNGVPAAAEEIHPAEEEVLAARLAELDATLPPSEGEAAPAEAPAPESAESVAPAVVAAPEPTTTEVVVKGLGSFGAITGFRQALSNVDGIESVALSLGQTGEFVFRANHTAGFDVRSAITTLEGDGAKIEDRPEGGLRVTLDRAR